jgi:histidine triad (HIT) family protein
VAECVFCEIVAGRSPVSAFYEDDVVLGLMTLGPVTEGHAMVLPKEHAVYLADLDEATGRHL